MQASIVWKCWLWKWHHASQGKRVRLTYCIRIYCMFYLSSDVKLTLDSNFLQLSPKASLNEKVNLIQLPNKQNLKDNQMCRVAGWGATKTAGKPVNELQQVNVTIINRKDCDKQWQRFWKLPKNVICAGGYKSNSGFCQVCCLCACTVPTGFSGGNHGQTKWTFFLPAGWFWWASGMWRGGSWNCVFQLWQKLRLPESTQHLHRRIKICSLDQKDSEEKEVCKDDTVTTQLWLDCELCDACHRPTCYKKSRWCR